MPYDRQDQRGNQRPGQKGPGGQPPGLKPSKPMGSFFLWMLIIGLLLLGVYALVQQAKRAKRRPVTIGEFYESVRNHEIASANIKRNSITGKYRAPGPEQPPEYSVPIHDIIIEDISKRLDEYNTNRKEGVEPITIRHEVSSELLQFFLVNLLPILLIVFILWYLLARQFRSAGGAGSVLSFGKARAKLHTKEQSNVTFDQVAGIEEAKEEVLELVEFLKNPPKFRRLGGRIPRGVLLVGPPGCGKTLLAKAIAGEAEVPFFSISGSDFIEMFVGVGASRVRDLFRQAKENCPCIIFLDEVDAVGRRRAVDLHGASAEGAQTLNAILVEMDGFDTDDNVIVISATNRPDVLDPALLRPGRFDRQIVVDLPDMRGREAILRVHAKKYKLADDVDLRQAARGTPSFSGADLEALLNEAALLATRKDKKAVGMMDIEEARDKVRWGSQRRSRVMSGQDRKLTAYHEGGHALIAKLLPEAEPLHKVSIIPHGMALGMTMSLPERDRYYIQRKEILAQLCVLLAGRVAEEIFCDDITSGAQNDLDRATDIARSMVCRWGMSERIGPVSYHEIEEPSFWGNRGGSARVCSESMSIKIDEEISRIIHEAHEHARTLITEHQAKLENLAQALLKYEVLYAKEVDDILAGREVVRSNTDTGEDVPPSAEEQAREESSEAGGQKPRGKGSQ